MELMESIKGENAVRGITLNRQHIELFNLLGNGSQEDVKRVCNYLKDLYGYQTLDDSLSLGEKVKIVLEKDEDLSTDERAELTSFLSKIENALKIRNCWEDENKVKKVFEENGLNPKYSSSIQKLKRYFSTPRIGLLTLLVDKDGKPLELSSFDDLESVDEQKTFDKVKALYEYVTGNLSNGEKRFNRLTLDSQGKFGMVAGSIRDDRKASHDDYNFKALRDAFDFAKANGMTARLNAFVFFKDLPERLVRKK